MSTSRCSGPAARAVGELHGQGLPPPARGREVRRRPVQPRQPEQARHHPGGPPQRKPEQHLDRQVRAGSRRPRPPPAGRAARHATHARPSPGPPRSAASPAGAGPHCRRTSSSHGGGQAWASSSGPPTCLSTQREACAGNVLQHVQPPHAREGSSKLGLRRHRVLTCIRPRDAAVIMPRARMVVEDRVQIKAACSEALCCRLGVPIPSHDCCAIPLLALFRVLRPRNRGRLAPPRPEPCRRRPGPVSHWSPCVRERWRTPRRSAR